MCGDEEEYLGTLGNVFNESTVSFNNIDSFHGTFSALPSPFSTWSHCYQLGQLSQKKKLARDFAVC